MTLRIVRSPQTGASGGVPFDPSKLLASIGLLSAVNGEARRLDSCAMFAELQSGKPQLSKNKAAVSASIEELNKMLSVLHRLEAALSAAMAGADAANAAAVCRAIAKSAPGRKLTMLFDPRRSDERFRTLLKKLNSSVTLDLRTASEAMSLLAEVESSVLSEISSKERYLQLADLEAENIKAQESVLAGMELSVLYKLFKAS